MRMLPLYSTRHNLTNSIRMNFVRLSALLFLFSISNVAVAYPGCLDSLACNYDVLATSDDGSCLYFDPCGVCDGNGIIGCTDSIAENYDPNATCLDGSCVFCGSTPIAFDPIHFFSHENGDYETKAAQVFTADQNITDALVSVSVQCCKLNGLVDMILEILPTIAGEPDWGNSIASVIVPEAQIPEMQSGCSVRVLNMSVLS